MIDKYPTLQSLRDDIASIKVQGATNVARATIKGIKIAKQLDLSDDDSLKIGVTLSTTRENEPMARNAVKYIALGLKEGKDINNLTGEFEGIINRSKEDIIRHGANLIAGYGTILTHCHSSSSTQAIIAASKIRKDLKVVSTETRPRYQGRITAKELVEAGVDTTMIVDSSVSSFIVDDTYMPVEAVFIGADEIVRTGDVINKVGSYNIALAAKNGGDDFYVLASLLKMDLESAGSDKSIEMRSPYEVWEDAPIDLKIINPSFEKVPADLISGYVTEVGIVSKDNLVRSLESKYPWAMRN